jgi:putative phosphonate catabolism associated alcohol dehydrogenase
MQNPQARAMVFEAVGQPFSQVQMELPELNTDEALIQIDYTTICTSDLHTFYGKRGGACHSILGHEIMGTIVKVPVEGIHDYYGHSLQIGDRVTWSVYAHDKSDPMAKKGIPQKSNDLFKYGHEPMNGQNPLNGGFATHCHLRHGSTLFKLPSNLSQKEAAPLNCTHATMAGAIRLAGDLNGKNVLVNGVGMLGLSACAIAKELGANTVFSMDVDESRLTHSKKFGVSMGLDAVLTASEVLDIVAKEGGIDVVIETSGVPSAIEKSMAILNIGGICVMVGAVYTQRDLAINAEHMVRKLLTLKGLHNYAHDDLRFAIDFLSKNHKKYPFGELVGAEFPLHQLDDAFELAHEGTYYRVGIHP